MEGAAGKFIGLLGFILLAFPVCPTSAQEAGTTVVLRGKLTDNAYVAGGTVDVFAEAERDLVVAGGTITIREVVKGDIAVAGGSVNLTARVGDDVRAAGGSLIVGGEVGRDLVAVGGTVTLAPESRVGGRAWLAGGDVTVAGQLARGLRVAAGSVRLAGAVDGDVEITAGTIEILPTARIRGNLTYTSPDAAEIDPGAQIQGRVTHRRLEAAARAEQAGRAFFGVARVVLLVGLILFAVVLLLLVPGFMVSAGWRIRTHFWKSLGLGLLIFVVMPLVAVLVIATIIGLPLGLTLAALYPVLLIVGYLTTAVFVGELGARLSARGSELTTGRRVLWLVVALIVLGLASTVPIVGWMLAWLAVVIGLGAATQEVFRRWAEARS
ncbi:MAG TPA: polymer-forming cytoskeletal protein [Methylomirabilota bacterium]|nr:polymer-forming cytoskeletal protein [Methylomirabilota bacterium]